MGFRDPEPFGSGCRVPSGWRGLICEARVRLRSVFSTLNHPKPSLNPMPWLISLAFGGPQEGPKSWTRTLEASLGTPKGFGFGV